MNKMDKHFLLIRSKLFFNMDGNFFFVLQKLSSIFQPVLAFSSDVHFNSIDVLFPALKQEVVLSILMPLPFACQLRLEVNLPSYLIFRDSSINLACAVDTHALELIIPLPLKG